MNPHGVSQLYLVKLSSGCLRVKRVRQKGVLRERSSRCGEDCADLFERALTHRVATRSKDSGAARDLQCVSGGGKGIDPGQATTALNVERTLCASGEGLPLMPSPGHCTSAQTAGVDAGAQDVAATIAWQPGGSARASHAATPAHGPGDRGRGSTPAVDPTLWHQSNYPLRGGGGGG